MITDATGYLVMHPKWVLGLQLTPKERWKIKYRAERLARRGVLEPPVRMTIGEYVGFSWIDGPASE